MSLVGQADKSWWAGGCCCIKVVGLGTVGFSFSDLNSGPPSLVMVESQIKIVDFDNIWLVDCIWLGLKNCRILINFLPICQVDCRPEGS